MQSTLDTSEETVEEEAKPSLRRSRLRDWGSAAARNVAVAANHARSSVVSAATVTTSTATKIPQLLGFVESNFKDDGDDDEEVEPPQETATRVEKIGELRSALGAEDADALSDEFLMKCLTQYYGNVGKAAEVARGFVSFRRSAAWQFRIAAHDVELPLRTGMHWLLPTKSNPSKIWTAGGGDTIGPAACLVYNASKLDVDVCPVEEYQKMGSFLMERATDDQATQERGIALIIDNAGVELLPMLRIMSLADMKRGVLMWKGAFPCRIRRLWVVDAPKGSGTVAKALLKLLAPRVQERIRFARRGDEKRLSQLVEDLGDIFELPRSLGGEKELDWQESVAALFSKDELAIDTSEDISSRNEY